MAYKLVNDYIAKQINPSGILRDEFKNLQKEVNKMNKVAKLQPWNGRIRRPRATQYRKVR